MIFNKIYARGGVMTPPDMMQQGDPEKEPLTKLTPDQQRAYDAMEPEKQADFMIMITPYNEKALLDEMTNEWENNISMEDQTIWRGNYSDAQLAYFDEYMDNPDARTQQPQPVRQQQPNMAQGGRFKLTKKS